MIQYRVALLACLAVLSGCAATSSGYSQSSGAWFDDLEGAQASSADGSLRARGYRDVDAFRSGSTLYTVWYGSSQRECLEMAVADGRVISMRSLASHARCGPTSGHDSSGWDDDYQGSSSSYRGLLGAQASSADGNLRRMGFIDVDDYRSGRNLVFIWYNPDSRECLEMTVADGEVVGLDDIGRHPQCRHSGGSAWDGDANQLPAPGGNAGSDWVQGLVGTRQGDLTAVLRGRGFDGKGYDYRDGERITTWWNSRSRHCLETVVRGDRVVRVNNHVRSRVCR